MEWMNEILKMDAQLLPPREWAKLLIEACTTDGADNTLARFVSLFEDDSGHDNKVCTDMLLAPLLAGASE